MSGRVLEAIFRRPLQLLLLIIILPLIGVAVVYAVFPRTYQSTATLWAFHRYEVIGLSGPETDVNSTPAQTQANALNELLQAKEFALSIAKATDLPSTLPASTLADPYLRDNALYSEISTHVLAAAVGYNLFEINYSNKNPNIAQQVVTETIKNFGLQSQGFSSVEAQLLLEGSQAQLTSAKQKAAQAATAESNYITAHPRLTPAELQSDPEYALLHAQTQQAQTTVQNIQTSIDTINQEMNAQGTGPDSLFKELDSPGIIAASRTKDYLYGGGVGLAVALIASIFYIVTTARRDRTIRNPLDLQQLIALPVVMQVPYLSSEAVSFLVDTVEQPSIQ